MRTCIVVTLACLAGLLCVWLEGLSQIQVQDASVVWTQPLFFSSGFETALPATAIRIMVANASNISKMSVVSSDEMLAAAVQVREHLMVEYASCVFTVSLVPEAGTVGLCSPEGPRLGVGSMQRVWIALRISS